MRIGQIEKGTVQVTLLQRGSKRSIIVAYKITRIKFFFKLEGMRWVDHVIRMDEHRNPLRALPDKWMGKNKNTERIAVDARERVIRN